MWNQMCFPGFGWKNGCVSDAWDINVAELIVDVHGPINTVGIIHDENNMPVFPRGRKNEEFLRHIRKLWFKRAILNQGGESTVHCREIDGIRGKPYEPRKPRS